MVYTIQNKQDAVVELVLQTTEKNFAPSKGLDPSLASQVSKQENAEVYFQIED